jgi:hypothetical protein
VRPAKLAPVFRFGVQPHIFAGEQLGSLRDRRHLEILTFVSGATTFRRRLEFLVKLHYQKQAQVATSQPFQPGAARGNRATRKRRHSRSGRSRNKSTNSCRRETRRRTKRRCCPRFQAAYTRALDAGFSCRLCGVCWMAGMVDARLSTRC